MARKSTLYVRQADIDVLRVNGKEFHVCKRRSKNGSNWKNSPYLYECNLCIHSVDRKGRFIHKYDDEDGWTPHQLWCEFKECPFKSDYENRPKRKQIKSDFLNQLLEKFEKGEL